jgi:hypothetical protein
MHEGVMGILLELPDGLEDEFWGSAVSVQQLLGRLGQLLVCRTALSPTSSYA